MLKVRTGTDLGSSQALKSMEVIKILSVCHLLKKEFEVMLHPLQSLAKYFVPTSGNCYISILEMELPNSSAKLP
jgi:hypothetical protein